MNPRTEFEQLLTPILNTAYGTALRLTGDRSTAEDLVQDTALLAWRAFASFQLGTNFKAWFFRILTNAFYGSYRRERHQRGEISLDDAPLYLYKKTRELGLHSLEDPAAALMDRLDGEQIARALQALPTEYRVVAILYFMEDFSYQHIADVVGCPVGTLKSRLHRARRLLQRALWQVAEEQGITAWLGTRTGYGAKEARSA